MKQTNWLTTGDRESLAWAAGLFDGEGSFMIHRGSTDRTKHRLVCSTKLGMTDFPIVETFAEVVGFGNMTIKKATNPKHNNQLEWRTAKYQNFQQLVCMLWPWLGERRKTRITAILREYQQWAVKRPIWKHHGGVKPIPLGGGILPFREISPIDYPRWPFSKAR